MGWFTIGRVYATTTEQATVKTLEGVGVVIDAWALSWLMVLWILVICALTQMAKLGWVAVAISKGKRYRRVVPLIPLVVGIVTGLAFADNVAHSLSFVVPWPTAALMLGPVAGMLAGWSWVFGRRIVMPAILSIAPTATRRALVGILARIGVDVADVADVGELGLQESSGVYHD